MGEKWVNYTFPKYQLFLVNPKKKIQEKAEWNIRINKFRKSLFWLMAVRKTILDPSGNLSFNSRIAKCRFFVLLNQFPN